MKIQINTDHNIKGHEHLITKFTTAIEDALNRISNHITLLIVHLSEENGHKTGPNDKRCLMEARLEGRQPIAVTNNADTLEQAVDGCTDKLINTIESILGRLRGHRKSGASSHTEISDLDQFEY